MNCLLFNKEAAFVLVIDSEAPNSIAQQNNVRFCIISIQEIRSPVTKNYFTGEAVWGKTNVQCSQGEGGVTKINNDEQGGRRGYRIGKLERTFYLNDPLNYSVVV